MRELQMWEADEGLDHAFADVQALAEACRFRDCSHQSEPGCAVTAAVEDGALAAERLDSYHRLQREDAYLRSRNDPAARAEQTRQVRRLMKAVRLHYKLGRR
jgi:ribosome biogenesis GTPase